MRYSNGALAALVASSMAQTPPGFEPAVEANLAVIFDAGAVEEPGTSFTIEGTFLPCITRRLVSNVANLQKPRSCPRSELMSLWMGLTPS